MNLNKKSINSVSAYEVPVQYTNLSNQQLIHEIMYSGYKDDSGLLFDFGFKTL